MPLLGTAALAMWWDMAPETRADFEDWHAHEHLPERLSIPGFRRGTRWASAEGKEGMFVMYELESYEVLSSQHYTARLNAPTPWSTRMMPHHRNMVRSQCRVLESRGGSVARQALTVRLSPAEGREQGLRAALKSLIASLAMQPGLAGAHLLRHETPAMAATTEQKIRGADKAADWVLVVCAYDAAVLGAAMAAQLSPSALAQLGAAPQQVREVFSLQQSVVSGDIA